MSFILKDATVVAVNREGTAILVDAVELDEPVWVPQSQIEAESEIWKRGDEGDLVVTEWIAGEKGWLD